MKSEHSTVSDEQLAREAKAGSLEAFEQLVSHHEARVYTFIAQLCPNPADVQELTQDTFVAAFQNFSRFEERRALAPWLFTIARRKCIDRHRVAPPIAESSFPELVEEADPAELAARREDGEELWQLARERLGKTQYETLWLHYAEDMNVGEIAQVLGKTRVHVKVLLFRARQLLARALKLQAGDVALFDMQRNAAAREAGATGRMMPRLTSLARTE